MPHYGYQSEAPDDPDRCCLVWFWKGQGEESGRVRQVGRRVRGHGLIVVENNEKLR